MLFKPIFCTEALKYTLVLNLFDTQQYVFPNVVTCLVQARQKLVFYDVYD